MADFLTRLAERTLGAVPMVQPLVAPGFAPEPTANPPDSGWNAETPSSGEPRDAAPPADVWTGRPGNPVVEHPGDRDNVAPDDPTPGEDESGVASPPGARASSPPKPRPAEDVPDRTSSRPAERKKDVAPPIRPPRDAYETGARAPVKPVGETQPDRDAPDEFRSTEARASAPDARSGVSSRVRSVVNASQSKQEGPEPGALAARVEPAEKMPAAQDTAEGRSGEVAKALERGQEEPSPTIPNRAARAVEISTVIPTEPARRPGPSGETTARPAAPPASSDLPDLPSHAPGRIAEQDRRQGLLPEATPDGRESGPQAEAPPAASSAPDSTLARPMVGPSDAHTGGGPRWQPPPEPSGPIIRVNIGRVEVRAVTPTPQRQQAAKPARLSLDDYLRSRSGGRR